MLYKYVNPAASDDPEPWRLQTIGSYGTDKIEEFDRACSLCIDMTNNDTSKIFCRSWVRFYFGFYGTSIIKKFLGKAIKTWSREDPVSDILW